MINSDPYLLFFHASMLLSCKAMIRDHLVIEASLIAIILVSRRVLRNARLNSSLGGVS